jgi:hypothetical protein
VQLISDDKPTLRLIQQHHPPSEVIRVSGAIKTWAPGRNIEDHIVSALVEARKPLSGNRAIYNVLFLCTGNSGLPFDTARCPRKWRLADSRMVRS